MIVGNCALCAETTELRLSHYLPAGAYRALTSAKNPTEKRHEHFDPITGKRFLTNKQLRKHLLCSKCEQRFSTNGECIVLKELLRDSGKFECRDKLIKAPISQFKEGLQFYTNDMAGKFIDFDAYLYFALSVFWRGTVTEWNPQTRHYFGAIIPRYRKQIRKYLLGIASHPSDLFLWVEVDLSTNPAAVLAFPEINKKPVQDGIKHHTFSAPGLIFRLFLGPAVSNFMTKLTVHSGSPVMFSTCSFVQHGLWDILANKRNKAALAGKAIKGMGA